MFPILFHPVQLHTYDTKEDMILISSTITELNIYISILTGVELDGMTPIY
jgi:hypothetical protein